MMEAWAGLAHLDLSTGGPAHSGLPHSMAASGRLDFLQSSRGLQRQVSRDGAEAALPFTTWPFMSHDHSSTTVYWSKQS